MGMLCGQQKAPAGLSYTCQGWGLIA